MATKKKAAKKAALKKKAPAKKKAAGKLSLTMDNNSLTVSVEFRLGGGEITAKLFRNTTLVGRSTTDITGSIKFDDARSGDELSITGACAGKAKISTNRDTTPLSSPSSPLKFSQENIFAILGVN
jgi:hypothetical protein